MKREEEITRESWKRYPNSPERNFGTGDYEYPEYHDAEREAFEAGAEWIQKTMIDKACKWLKEHYAPAGFVDGIFRKAMEE